MPQNPDWKRYLEAGLQFTELQRSQARAIASDLARKDGTVALWELSERLARPTFDRVVEALELARGDRVSQLHVLQNAA